LYGQKICATSETFGLTCRASIARWSAKICSSVLIRSACVFGPCIALSWMPRMPSV
jgi:hypothetical protein